MMEIVVKAVGRSSKDIASLFLFKAVIPWTGNSPFVGSPFHTVSVDVSSVFKATMFGSRWTFHPFKFGLFFQ